MIDPSGHPLYPTVSGSEYTHAVDARSAAVDEQGAASERPRIVHSQRNGTRDGSNPRHSRLLPSYARAVRPLRLVVPLLVAMSLAACGGAPSAVTQIRQSVLRLKAAVRDRDASKFCELLFPFGQDQPLGALAAQLRKLDTPAGRASYRASIKRCILEVAKNPRNERGDFGEFNAAFRGVLLGKVFVHGNTATTDRSGRVNFVTGTLNFVKAAGEWRLLVGVQ